MKRMKSLQLIVALLISINVSSQTRNWTIEDSKDGKSTVKYELVDEGSRTHFYYIAETTVSTTLDELDSYFSNTENHKNFIESTTTTEKVKQISENEWLAYYFFDAPWPLPNSDVVLKINRTKTENKLVFTAQAISHDYKKSDTDRMTDYKIIYELERIDNNTTKITYNADYLPYGSIPNFLIKSWFPEGPAGIVSNLGLMK